MNILLTYALFVADRTLLRGFKIFSVSKKALFYEHQEKMKGRKGFLSIIIFIFQQSVFGGRM